MTDRPDFIHRIPWHRVPAWGLLPALLIGAVLTQQTTPALLTVGRVASAAGVVCAICLLLQTFRGAAWALLLVTLVVGLRALRITWPGPGMEGAYQLAFLMLYVVTGAALAICHPRLIERQLFWVCAISVPVMLLQLLGVGTWTQVLRTDLSGPSNLVQVRTLGLWPGRVAINALQVRPAGLFASNNTFSVVLMFATALVVSQWHGARLRKRDFTLIGAIVLSMAKVALLAGAALMAWRLLRGDASERRYAVRFGLALLVLLAVYAVAFPGVFAYNLSPSRALLNVRYRVTDFAAAVPVTAVRRWAFRQPAPIVANLSRLSGEDAKSRQGVIRPVPTQSTVASELPCAPAPAAGEDVSTSQSGYADIAAALPVLLLAGCLLAPAYRRGRLMLQSRDRTLAAQSSALLIVVLIVPLVTSYLLGALFAMMLGATILPALVADSQQWAALAGAARLQP